jgi:hypothetical protein
MSRLDTTLSHRVRNKEEIKSAIDHLTLLHKALINVSALRRIVNEGLTIGGLSLLEESLTHSLVDNDESNLWWLQCVPVVVRDHTIFFGDDLVKLLQFKVNNLLTHGISNTVTVDKDVCGHLAIVEITVCLERALEVV